MTLEVEAMSPELLQELLDNGWYPITVVMAPPVNRLEDRDKWKESHVRVAVRRTNKQATRKLGETE